MVYMNLLGEKKAGTKHFVPATILMSFVGLVFLLFPFSFHSEKTDRVLQLEEREVVLSVLGRLDRKAPEISQWTKTLKAKILNESLNPVVTTEGNNLARYANNQLFFLKDFFSADSIEQETSLMHLMVSMIPILTTNKEAVGVVGE